MVGRRMIRDGAGGQAGAESAGGIARIVRAGRAFDTVQVDARVRTNRDRLLLTAALTGHSKRWRTVGFGTPTSSSTSLTGHEQSPRLASLRRAWALGLVSQDAGAIDMEAVTLPGGRWTMPDGQNGPSLPRARNRVQPTVGSTAFWMDLSIDRQLGRGRVGRAIEPLTREREPDQAVTSVFGPCTTATEASLHSIQTIRVVRSTTRRVSRIPVRPWASVAVPEIARHLSSIAIRDDAQAKLSAALPHIAQAQRLTLLAQFGAVSRSRSRPVYADGAAV